MRNYTTKQITKGFEYLVIQLEELHPNPFLFISKEDLNKDFEKLAIESEHLEEKSFFFNLMSIFSKIKDSHTRVKGIGKILTDQKYPFRLKCLDNKYYISSILSEKKEFVGSQVFSINGVSIENIILKFSEVITYENDIVLSNAIEQWIYEPDILNYLGIVDERLINIQLKNGNILTLEPNFVNEEDLYNPRIENIKSSKTLNPIGQFSTQVFPDLNTYYLQYNECEDITKEEVDQITTDIKQIDLKYVVIDLRNNVGGSSLILDPLTDFLYQNQDKYTPVVFLSNITYSAAIINALNILDCKNAISIGTKTSGSPTKFGETTTIKLPITNIEVVISTKYFEEKGYTFGQPLVPQIQTKQTIEEYLNGIDSDWIEFLKHRK